MLRNLNRLGASTVSFTLAPPLAVLSSQQPTLCSTTIQFVCSTAMVRSRSSLAAGALLFSCVQQTIHSFSLMPLPLSTTPRRLYATTSDNKNVDAAYFRYNNNNNNNATDDFNKQKINGAASVDDNNNGTVRKQQPSISSIVLSIDPAEVQIVNVPPKQAPSSPAVVEAQQLADDQDLTAFNFVNMFRGSANYIANHRNTIAVYHIPGILLDYAPDPTLFRNLMNDISLTWLLGMRIVIVVGCRHQIEKRLSNTTTQYNDGYNGLRVTDQDTLRVVKEEAGYVRFEVERQLARSLRMQGGSSTTAAGIEQGYYDGNVVSGNFYSAQPFGVRDGVDYK
jgi:hypothetical protein